MSSYYLGRVDTMLCHQVISKIHYHAFRSFGADRWSAIYSDRSRRGVYNDTLLYHEYIWARYKLMEIRYHIVSSDHSEHVNVMFIIYYGQKRW